MSDSMEKAGTWTAVNVGGASNHGYFLVGMVVGCLITATIMFLFFAMGRPCRGCHHPPHPGNGCNVELVTPAEGRCGCEVDR